MRVTDDGNLPLTCGGGTTSVSFCHRNAWARLSIQRQLGMVVSVNKESTSSRFVVRQESVEELMMSRVG